MKKYSEKIHAQNLLEMLERNDPCSLCPAKNAWIAWPETPQKENEFALPICEICQGFVGYEYDVPNNKDKTGCPCFRGKHEAIKRTWIALEEKGYI